MDNLDLSAEEEKEVLSLAIRYKREAEKCFYAKAYLAGCVLIGAAMEALLLSSANCFPEIATSAKSAPKRNGKVRPLREWSFNNLLRVAEEINWLPSGLSENDDWNDAQAEIGDYVDVVRQIRNLVHPARYAGDFAGKKVTKKYYEACFRIVESASDHLLQIIEAFLKVMKDEQKRRKAPNTGST